MIKKGLIIYEPAGRAHEYAPLAINLYRGCGHGCVYCFAPGVLYLDREKFQNEAAPRPNMIEKLKKDIPIAAATYVGYEKRVLLCFTTDPYSPIDEIHQLTRHAITILHENGFTVNILTKGGHRAERDFDLLGPKDQFAVTLTSLSEKKSLEWEPKAATPAERIASLRHAHELGIETWASLEPVLDPAEAIQIIRDTHEFVDLFKVGKLNYAEKLPPRFQPQVRGIDWSKFAHDVVAELERLGCRFYIKNDLRRYL